MSSFVRNENETRFLERVLFDGYDKYKFRLSKLGWKGDGKFLDAGCGYGQWSIAASYEKNAVVTGIDANRNRIFKSRELASEQGKKIDFHVGQLEQLPFDDEEFDFVFCYSSIYYCNYEKACKELTRVLKVGGKIYICSNGLGWYIKNLVEGHNSTKDFSARKLGLKSLLRSMGFNKVKGGENIISIKQLEKTLCKNGINNIKASGEGKLGNPKIKAPVFFQSTYMGFVCVYEMTGEK